MKTRRQDALTGSRRSTRALTSVENSKTIPIDLFIEILLRLPAKSIARCRCVSKSWAYILRRTCFTELFLTSLNGPPWGHGIVCFDVRSEKFKFVNKAEDMELWSGTTLVNYKGKLGVLLSFGYITQDSEYFELWVLIDAEKHEWSKHVCVLPPLWKNIVSDTMLEFVGMTSRGEIVMSTCYLSNPFYVYYYNIEDNTITRVEVQGMEAFMKDNTVTSIESQGMDAFVYCRVHISLSHVEDVKLM
ncbi:hypothetical protein Bca4012_057190 [Brassica carinata]